MCYHIVFLFHAYVIELVYKNYKSKETIFRPKQTIQMHMKIFYADLIKNVVNVFHAIQKIKYINAFYFHA